MVLYGEGFLPKMDQVDGLSCIWGGDNLMWLLHASEYAMQTVVYLARKPDGEYILIRKISKDLDIPHHSLSKIIPNLVQAKILTSHKGPKGGVALLKNPSEITMMEISTIIDGDEFASEHKCIMGLKKCDDDEDCPLHLTWSEKRKELREMFSSKSLAELLEETKG